MRAIALVALAAVTVLSAAACSGDDTDEPKAAASAALSSATAAAASALSEVSSAAASAISEAASAAASAASEVAPAASPASPAAKPAGDRPADNTVRVEVEGKATRVYPPQNCSTVPGLDGFSFAGQAEGGGQLVIVATGAGEGSITVLGGEVGAGNATFDNLVLNPDGTFYGSTKFLEIPVSFYGHCDELKK